MKKALLIVDLQKAFEPSPRIVQEILRIAPDYSEVLATKYVNGNPLSEIVLQCPDIPEAELELEELPERTKIFNKRGYGLSREVVEYLKDRDIEQVDVVGYQTEACVLACTFSLWDAEIKPVVLEHLVGARKKNKHLHEGALKIIKRYFAKRSKDN